MKYRSDFVTNSSSSSFILGFKDKDSIAETIEKDMAQFKGQYPNEMSILIQDCMNSETRSLPALMYYLGKEMDYCLDFDDDDIEEFIKELQQYGHIAVVEYSDDYDGTMEHTIVPALDCCIKRISHH